MANASETLVEKVKQSLLDRYKRDRSPLTEHDLCRHLGVSRGAIREALSQLDQQGLIERRQKNGTSLKKPSLKELVELWDVRCGFEAMAVRLACSNVTAEDLQRLRDLCRERAEAAKQGNEDRVNEADIEFHMHLIAMSGNTIIHDMVRKMHLFDRIFRIAYTVPAYWPEDEQVAFGHEAIIDALARRDADLAENLIKRHIQGAKKRRIESLIGKLDVFESSGR